MIEELAREYWELVLRTSPVSATALGDRRYDHLMGDNSRPGRERHRGEISALLGRVREIPAADTVTEAEVTRRELVDALERGLGDLDAALDEWTVSPMSGPQNFYMNIPDLTTLRTPEEVEAYVQRLAAMEGHLDNSTEDLGLALAEDRVANRKAVERTLEQVDALLSQGPASWSLLTHLEKLPETIPAAAADALRTRAREVLEAGLQPAFVRYRNMLREQVLPAARPDDRPGLMHVPGGAEAYQGLIRIHTSLELEPERIHEIGLEEVASIREEILELGARALQVKDFVSLKTALREDRSLYFETSEQIETSARDTVRAAEAAVPDFFGLRPSTRCEVRPIPAHEAPHSPIAYYRQPAPDGSRSGAYYVNTLHPETRPRFEAQVLAIHEAVPGHHLQIDIAQQLEHLPEFRKHGHVTAYVEGWALYTERLGDEMGIYESDIDRFGKLSFDLWRSVRLVVDTGLHALGWSRQRAIDYMVENTILAENNIVNEVDRYVVMPGQALSYKLGQLAVFRHRREAEERLGDAFRLPDFHDFLLRHGAVSLRVLEELFRAWLVERQA